MDAGAERVPVRAFGRDALWIAFLALAYFLAHEAALLFPGAPKVVAAIWPAGGIGLAALLLSPRRRWPVILPILFLTGILADLLSGRSLFASDAPLNGSIDEFRIYNTALSAAAISASFSNGPNAVLPAH